MTEVIVSLADFREYVRLAVGDTAWEDLPEQWREAVDQLLIEDVAVERGDAVHLDDLLAGAQS